MKVQRVDVLQPDPEHIAHAARILLAGGLVVFPTETVYGLGADASNPAAVRRIFEAKGRPSFNPLILHVCDVSAARRLASHWPAAAESLAAAFWPGPLTLVLHRGAGVPDEVTGGLDTFGVRMPAHPVAHALLQAAGVPVAAPSANAFTRISPTRAEHVIASLGDRFDLLLDAGATPVGIESTVLDLTTSPPRVLRPGSITVEELRGLLPEVVVADGEPESAPRSPGRIARHYAPRTPAEIAPDAESALRRLEEDREAGALLLDPRGAQANARIIAMPSDPREYARALYAALHKVDESGRSRIVIEQVPDTPEWAAVRDRIGRATG
jgi:L-threonylcarbamoyladenylate synthase